jgi:transposase InsO family protein
MACRWPEPRGLHEQVALGRCTGPSPTTAWSDQWAKSAPPATTSLWTFFSLLQKNVLDRRTWATRDDLRIEIITWIERTYHRRRRQARLGRLTPVEYETIMTPQTAPAA